MFVQLPGGAVPLEQLRNSKARDLAMRLNAGELAYARLVETRQDSDDDLVVLDVEPEVPQVRDHDIRPTERLAVRFSALDRDTPRVLALRLDFPDTGHMIPTELAPRELCVFAEGYAELRLRWTSKYLVDRVLEWLRLTACNELHQADQPLEQVLAGGAGAVFLPLAVVQEESAAPCVLHVRNVHRDQSGAFIDLAIGPNNSGNEDYLAIRYVAPIREPGAIRIAPENFAALNDLVGGGLLDDARNKLRGVYLSDRNRLQLPIVFVTALPVRRTQSGEVERVETWAFLAGPALDVGAAIGLWAIQNGVPGIHLSVDMARTGAHLPLQPFHCQPKLTRAAAAGANGLSRVENTQFLAVGAGALGSQVIMNMARAGYGRWTVADHDRILPHNYARHALAGIGLGSRKAAAITFLANSVTDDENAFSSLVVDVLASGPAAAALDECLRNATVVVDLAASVPVARQLALDAPGDGRRVSLFLNPTGTDLVLLAEDRLRSSRLDALEMQYYRAVIQESALAGHLTRGDSAMRYGLSCRDVTLQLPQDRVALHASTASAQLKKLLSEDAAAIRVWRLNPDLGTVSRVDVEVGRVIERSSGDWTIVYDERLLGTLRARRNERLPSETGGVLVGAFDMQRRKIYLVDGIPSPPDSEETGTGYIRGVAGLAEALEEASQKTFGQSGYVGEWHAHPDGHFALPSGDDRELFQWLVQRRRPDGVPVVMLILAEDHHSIVISDGSTGAA